MGYSRHLFHYFSLFNTVELESKCSIWFLADDWIWTANLWNWKQPLYQLSYNHCRASCTLLISEEQEYDASKKRWFVYLELSHRKCRISWTYAWNITRFCEYLILYCRQNRLDLGRMQKSLFMFLIVRLQPMPLIHFSIAQLHYAEIIHSYRPNWLYYFSYAKVCLPMTLGYVL